MVSRILVALDGSHYSWSAAAHAIEIAQKCHASIYAISVTDVKIIEGQLLDDLDVDSATAQRLYQDRGRMLLEQFEGQCRDAGIEFHPLLTTGIVPGTIARNATQIEANLICLGKRGTNAPWSGPLLGATAEAVIRQAKFPVLLASEHHVPVGRAFVAYDGGFVSIRALRFVADLCACCSWKLLVISVHRSRERREKLLRDAAKIADLHNLKIEGLGVSGEPVDAILDATAQETDALLVAGVRSRRLLGFTLGNVAERLMRRTPHPILLYRPSEMKGGKNFYG